MALVYRHTKPCGEIFYIGIGVAKKRAYSKHGRNAWWHNTVKKNSYNVEIICDDVDYNTAKQIECYLISYYGRKDLGYGSLVNLTDGGEGATNMTPKEKKARKIRMAKYNTTKKDYSFTQTDEYKLKMGLATKGKGVKAIINTKTGVIYNSQTEACKELKISASYLSAMLNNKMKNNTDLIWKS
jgi:hypothetical protein